MTYKAAKDLLELVNLYIQGKTLFLSKTTENDISIIKTLENNNSDVNIKEGETLGIEESY
ncbi:hypothetical protein GH741_05135 [Aquibacillus halophilus]|uniref:Uncharacterized protein n=1 Tax=Aquibacillus halophilus TaxID=930132 RepID=A0A6A8D8Z1_9BACI|nr:hypothetical protein [Aquibacillus halophilus]MRH42058.1 hypothetical protein [Aquibacillus halophilus]